MIREKTITIQKEIVDFIQCDFCDRIKHPASLEYHEFISIRHDCGYTSIFGDGNRIELDMCQHCLSKLLKRELFIKES